MSRKKARPQPADFDLARDELFSHIHRCGVLQATDDQQVEWMDDTIQYLGERYPDLPQARLDELKEIGLRFCRPVVSRPAREEEETAGAAA